MADTQITGTLSADEAINGSISANEGINAELTPNEEISGTLEVRRTQEIIQAVWGTITGTLSDQTDLQGALDGKADLENGKVPSSQLPSYVDDVLEYASLSVFPATGEAGKIYIALDTNKTYRWSGSTYVEISESLALGETSGTAYEGSKGKTNADAIAKAYKTDDAAETTIDNADYFPFYDTSASAKRKTLWSNIKAKLKSYFDGIYTPTTLLQDTVGWTGKNLLNDEDTEVGRSWNGDTNANRARLCIKVSPSTSYILSMSGTSSLDYIGYALSSSIPASGLNGGEITSFPKTITTGNSDTWLTLAFNKTSIALSDIQALKLMLRRADITDSTYEPYHATVEEVIEQVYADNGVLGAKNIAVPLNNYGFTGSNQEGFKFSTGSPRKCIIAKTKIGKSYIASKASGIGDRFRVIGLSEYPNTSTYVSGEELYSNNSGDTFTVNNIQYPYLGVFLNLSATVSSDIQGMIRLASDPDNTFAPYAMTNRELTDKAYTTDDTAETDIQDSDYFPFYDTSATAKKKSLWSNIIAKIKAALATVATSGSYYDLVDEPQNETASAGSYTVSLCTRREKYIWNEAYNNSIKFHTGSALAGATSVYIGVDSITDTIVCMLADDGTTTSIKYKTIDFYSSGSTGDMIGLTFNALAHDTTFTIGMV